MYINEKTAISTSRVVLVPYESKHVPTYHDWMQDEEIQKATASEPLSLEEEYKMQSSWRRDNDKLTFIICTPSASQADLPKQQANATSGLSDGVSTVLNESPSQSDLDCMIGDVNLFLSEAEEDPEGVIGELELMIAPVAVRRQGYGRAAILTFMHYIQSHLDEILAEYASSRETRPSLTEAESDQGAGTKSKSDVENHPPKLLQLKVKVGSDNEKSIRLFESIGFIKVHESPNYFGEFELCLEGFLGHERTKSLMENLRVDDYREFHYET